MSNRMLSRLGPKKPTDEVSTFRQNPFEQNPFDQKAFEQNPFDQNPFKQNPFNQNPFQQNPFDQNPFEQNPFGRQIEQPAFDPVTQPRRLSPPSRAFPPSSRSSASTNQQLPTPSDFRKMHFSETSTNPIQSRRSEVESVGFWSLPKNPVFTVGNSKSENEKTPNQNVKGQTSNQNVEGQTSNQNVASEVPREKAAQTMKEPPPSLRTFEKEIVKPAFQSGLPSELIQQRIKDESMEDISSDESQGAVLGLLFILEIKCNCSLLLIFLNFLLDLTRFVYCQDFAITPTNNWDI